MIDNQIIQNVARPCSGCKIVGFTPTLVYTDGTEANIATGPMLHHIVLAANGGGKSDLTCAGTTVGLLGQRFFASGNERTAVDISSLPYGYEVGTSETWNLDLDLANWATTTKTVKVRITYKYATGTDSTSRTVLRPLWLDAAGCSTTSLISVPMGFSDTVVNWRAPVAGRVIAAAGHIHDMGVDEKLSDASTGGNLLCDSVAGYGQSSGYITPDGVRHISSMSVCTGNPIASIARGDTLRLETIYNSEMAMNDAMGLMLVYVG